MTFKQMPIFPGRQTLWPGLGCSGKSSNKGFPMIENTAKAVMTDDEALSDDELKDVSGGVDFDQLRRENLDKDASRLDDIRRENLEKD